VGIRGIALLTHRLEDLLQLLGERGGTPDPATRSALTEAADCLGEMADAVAGLGEGPADALGVCRSLGAHIDALLAGGVPPDTGGEPVVPGEPGAEAPGPSRPSEPSPSPALAPSPPQPPPQAPAAQAPAA